MDGSCGQTMSYFGNSRVWVYTLQQIICWKKPCPDWDMIVYRTLAEGGWENSQLFEREPPTDFALCGEPELKR